MRGFGTPLLAPPIVEWAVEWLKSHEVRHWLADPWGRMIVGTDENSNSDVGRWLDILDTIKERAGVENLIIPAHTGRAVQEIGSERARGATRLDDWADARWLLSVGTGEDEGRRFLRAHGRDVELAEGALTFDPLTGALTFGEGGRQAPGASRGSIEDRIIVALMKQQPQSRNQLVKSVGTSPNKITDATKAMGSQGLIHHTDEGWILGKRLSQP